jgi:hypothetical protein
MKSPKKANEKKVTKPASKAGAGKAKTVSSSSKNAATPKSKIIDDEDDDIDMGIDDLATGFDEFDEFEDDEF